MKFHEIRFPENISFGAVGGPERRSETVRLANGGEHVNAPWERSIRKFNVGTGIKSLDDLEAVVAFFEARNGSEIGFRWKDWADYKSSKHIDQISPFDQVLGFGDGVCTVFQIQKSYGDGFGVYQRKIGKPIPGTVEIAIDERIANYQNEYEVDYSTGLLTFSLPPEKGASVTAGFEFDVPVRFDIEHLAINISHFQAGEIQHIDVKEVI